MKARKFIVRWIEHHAMKVNATSEKEAEEIAENNLSEGYGIDTYVDSSERTAEISEDENIPEYNFQYWKDKAKVAEGDYKKMCLRQMKNWQELIKEAPK